MGYIEELRALVGHRRLILCGSCAVVENERGEVLLLQRKDPPGRWCFPGGLMELGESTEVTVRREVLEETALRLGELELIGIYSGEGSLCRASNGDEWYVVNVAYAARSWSGVPAVADDESAALGWFSPLSPPEELASSHKRILRDYLAMRKPARE